MSSEDAEALMQRDYSENEDYGQHAINTYQLSDFFIDWNSNDLGLATLDRILDLIFGNPFISPTFGEYAMFMAYASSLRSSDLSRQVGSVVTKNNEILSTGANDCPAFGGGLYWTTYDYGLNEYVDKEIGKDYKRGFDKNKTTFAEIAENVMNKLGVEYNDKSLEALRDSKLADLTEYGRCVHAEMESLLACSRNGISTLDSTMYVTTFPCHNCAKHIIAAGVKKVVYIEPYPKSKTFEMYDDSVKAGEPEDSTKDTESDKILFIPYYGVSPRRYVEVFAMKNPPFQDRKRKDSQGKNIDWARSKSHVRSKMIPQTYLDLEVIHARYYKNKKKEWECEKK